MTTAASVTPRPALREDYGAVWRTARKAWRCVCADDVTGWIVRGIYPGGWTERTFRHEADAWEQAVAWEGQSASRDGRCYTTVEVRPRPNPNADSRSPECTGDIAPGDAYVEYLGEAGAYQSGTRYCAACGVKTWGIHWWENSPEDESGGNAEKG